MRGLSTGRSRGTWLRHPGEHSPLPHQPPANHLAPPKLASPAIPAGTTKVLAVPWQHAVHSLMWLLLLQGLPGPQGSIGLPGPPGPSGPGVGICIPHPKLPFGSFWCLGCCLISAHVSLTGPTGCPWAARTSGECVVPLPCPASISVGAGCCWGGCETLAPQPCSRCSQGESGKPGVPGRDGVPGKDGEAGMPGKMVRCCSPCPVPVGAPLGSAGESEAEGCTPCARVYRDHQVLPVPRESEGMPEPQGR